jgi:hypothetical protein
VAHLKKVHAALLRAVSRLEDSQLDRKVPSDAGPTSLVKMLHGVAAHAAYHGGQIALQKKRLL